MFIVYCIIIGIPGAESIAPDVGDSKSLGGLFGLAVLAGLLSFGGANTAVSLISINIYSYD